LLQAAGMASKNLRLDTNDLLGVGGKTRIRVSVSWRGSDTTKKPAKGRTSCARRRGTGSALGGDVTSRMELKRGRCLFARAKTLTQHRKYGFRRRTHLLERRRFVDRSSEVKRGSTLGLIYQPESVLPPLYKMDRPV